jgi:hypothetical protein
MSTVKIVAGIVLLAGAVSLYFWVQALRADLAVAENNYAVEKLAHAAVIAQLATVRQQVAMNAALDQHQSDLHDHNVLVGADIKGATDHAKAEDNRMPPILLDVLDRLRVSRPGGPGADAVSAGGPASPTAPMRGGAADPSALDARDQRSTRSPRHRRSGTGRTRLPEQGRWLARVVVGCQAALLATGISSAALAHDWFEGKTNGKGEKCCDGEDCKPVRAWLTEDGSWQFLYALDGKTYDVPRDAMRPDDENPEPFQAFACVWRGRVMCFWRKRAGG